MSTGKYHLKSSPPAGLVPLSVLLVHSSCSLVHPLHLLHQVNQHLVVEAEGRLVSAWSSAKDKALLHAMLLLVYICISVFEVLMSTPSGPLEAWTVLWKCTCKRKLLLCFLVVVHLSFSATSGFFLGTAKTRILHHEIINFFPCYLLVG